MRRSINTLMLILALVVIIVLASIFILRGRPAEDSGKADAPVVTAAPPRDTDAPDPAGAVETPAATAPIVTREPIQTPAPSPAPAPTPAPTPKPTPIPAESEGTFRSDTGTGLNLSVDWKTYTTGGQRKLQADVYIVSYSIFTSYQWKSITLTVGDKAWSADCSGFSYEGKDQISTKAATFTVDAPPAGTPASVEWYYGGSYSGKDLT